MSRLWVFGDSYAVSATGQWQDHWAGMLCKQLACGAVEIRAHNGAPNEWIYYQLQQHVNHIGRDDYVVFISTQINRRWLFVNNVGSSNFQVQHVQSEKLTSEEKTAVQYYRKYLDNDLMAAAIFDSVCNAVHYIAEKNNLNLLIVPGFEESGYPVSGKYTVTGSLFDVCINEIKGRHYDHWYKFVSDQHKGVDPRSGHLSEENHIILSKKIFHTFKNNEPLNLASDFREDFV